MINSKNLSEPPSRPIQGELWSQDRTQVFRIIFHGYENPEEEWLVCDIDYQTRFSRNQIFKWEFDTLSLAIAAQATLKTKGYIETEQTLLRAPYQNEELKLVYKKGYLSQLRRPFLKNRHGLFVNGKFGDFEFKFKVNYLELKKFNLLLRQAAHSFPARTAKGAKLIQNATRVNFGHRTRKSLRRPK